MKYRIEIDINDISKTEKLYKFLAKTHNFNKKFYTWVLTREGHTYPVIRIKAIAISRDLEAELLWIITCKHTGCGQTPEPKPHDRPRDEVLPESMVECKGLYPRKYTCNPPLELPYMNVFELNDFLEVDHIHRQ